MFKKILLLLFSAISFMSFSQKNNYDVLVKNKVNELSTFLFESKTAKDSTLLTKEYYNNKGRILKVESFNKNDEKDFTFEFKYRFDTLKIASLKFENNILKVKTIYIYDKNNIKSQSVIYLNNQYNNFTKFIFNKEQQVIEVKEYKNKKLSYLVEYKYYSFGEIKEKIVKYPKKLRSETRYRKTRAAVEAYTKTEKKYDNYKDTGKKLINTILTFNRKTTYKTIKGKMDFEKRDELKTKSYYLKNGLLDYILQYKNDVLIAEKVYHY